jgi:ABC-type nitrate/sulfonate/bicarbonate transport system substrate-binding protein
MRKRVTAFLLSLAVTSLILDPVGGLLESAEKIRAVYNAIGTGQSPLWIPLEVGIFRKYGLDVELLYVGAGSRTAQVVVSGDAPLGMFNGGLVINSNLAGGDLVVVAEGERRTRLSAFFWLSRSFSCSFCVATLICFLISGVCSDDA